MKLDRSNIEAWLLDRIEGRLTPDQERELTVFLLAHPDLADELGELPTVADDPVTFTGKSALKRTLPPTGEVNAENLDEFLVARGEGDLGEAKKDELERYLAGHPEAAKAARQMAAARVGQERIPFNARPSITRTFPPQGLPDRHRIDDFLVARLHGELTAEQGNALDAWIAGDAAIAKAWSLMQHTQVVAEPVVFPGKMVLKKKEVKVIPLWSRPIIRLAAAASVTLLFGIWWLDRGSRVIDEHASVDPVRKVVRSEAPAPSRNESPTASSTPQNGTAAPNNEDTERTPVNRKDPGAPVDRAARARIERLAPVPASVKSGAINAGPLDAGSVPQVPISHDPPAATAGASGPGAMSMGELLASTVRKEVLERPAEAPRSLDRADAVALVDKGLQTLGGRTAGFDVQRTEQRRRFNLRLGGGLAIAASTTR